MESLDPNRMSDLALPGNLSFELPYSIQTQLIQLPRNAQREFAAEYYRRKKQSIIAYILQFAIMAPYGYYDEWGKQFLYWITLGGMGFWYLINFFRIPSKTRRHNQKLAEKLLKMTMAKYNINYGRKAPNQPIYQANRLVNKRNQAAQHTARPKARTLNVSYDPSNLSVENLKAGYLLDYNYKTWKVINENQFDWESGNSEKEFKLISDLDKIHLYLRKESGHLEIVECKEISIYAIDPLLEKEIIENKRPLNMVTYNGLPYYRENKQVGWAFNMPETENGKQIIMWEYLNEQRDHVIRIEQWAQGTFKTTVGKMTSEIKFSEILPGKL